MKHLGILLFAACLLFVPALRAQPAASGSASLTGTVSSDRTHTVLAGAVVSLPALHRQMTTDADGHFLFNGLPEGPQTLLVTYTDFEDRRVDVVVGQESGPLAVALHPLEVVTMSAYVVPAQVEGNALAITMQRNVPNAVDVLALDSDISATVPNYNIGELASRLPGVAANYSQGTVNELFVRGMPNTLTRMTFDGLSSVSAIDARRPTYTFFSGALFQDIQIVKGQTPDMSADSIGGVINLVTRSPLKLTDSRPHVDYDAGMVWSAPWGNYLTSEQRKRNLQPFVHFGYEQVFDILGGKHNLGVSLKLFYGENQFDIGQLTYNYQANQPNSPAYIWDARAQDSLNDRHITGINGKVEYRASDRHTFFFNYLLNVEHEPSIDLQSIRFFSNQTVATVDASGNPTGTGAILPGYTDNFTTVRAVAGSNAVIRDYHLTDFVHNDIFTLGGTSVFGPLTVAYVGRYNILHYDDGTGDKGSGGDLTMTDPTVGYTVDRSDINHPVITQNAGASVYNAANYTNSVTFSERNDTLDNDIAETHLDATYQFDTPFPLALKVGGAYKNQEHKAIQRDPRQYTPVAGTAFMPTVYMPSTPFTAGYPMVDARAVNLAVQNPALWTNNPYYTAMQDFSGNKGVTENVEAEYAQLQAKIGHLSVLGGIRVEETQDVSHAYVSVPVATAAQIPDPVARAIHDWDHPTEARGHYTKPFPALHLSYDILRNLTARAAYSTSFGRPGFATMLPNATINNTTDTVTTGNPGLGPQYAKNLDLGLYFYPAHAGMFSAAWFRKDISDYIATQNVGIIGAGPNNGYDGNYAGYNLLSSVNAGTAVASGWEFAYRQQLTFLPGLLKGLELSGSYTTLQTHGNYGGTTNTSGSQIANFIPRTATASLSYHYQRYGARVVFNYQGPYLFTAGATPSAAVYQDRRSTVSLNVNYRVLADTTVYAQFNNLFQQTQDAYIYEPNRLNTRQFVTAQVQFGIRGQF